MTMTVKKIEEDKNFMVTRRKERESEADEFKDNLISILNNAKRVFEENE
jgi:hypothetical protein